MRQHTLDQQLAGPLGTFRDAVRFKFIDDCLIFGGSIRRANFIVFIMSQAPPIILPEPPFIPLTYTGWIAGSYILACAAIFAYEYVV